MGPAAIKHSLECFEGLCGSRLKMLRQVKLHLVVFSSIQKRSLQFGKPVVSKCYVFVFFFFS